MNRARCLIALSAAVALSACRDRTEQPPPPSQPAQAQGGLAAKDAGEAQGTAAAAPDPIAQAEKIFATRCTVCHGPQGKGDGPGSAGLNPKPRNFTDPKWQSEVTDAYIEKIVLNGGLAVGKSAAMPPNPDLASKPEVIAGLRAHVRSLNGK